MGNVIFCRILFLSADEWIWFSSISDLSAPIFGLLLNWIRTYFIVYLNTNGLVYHFHFFINVIYIYMYQHPIYLCTHGTYSYLLNHQIFFFFIIDCYRCVNNSGQAEEWIVVQWENHCSCVIDTALHLRFSTIHCLTFQLVQKIKWMLGRKNGLYEMWSSDTCYVCTSTLYVCYSMD